MLYIEKQFECLDMPCVIIMTDMGHRCGYVGVTEQHKFYGESTSEEIYDINVHGGVTFSEGGGEYPIEKAGIWWFGFDCAHAGDGKELYHPAVSKENREIYKGFHSWGVVRSLDYCVEQCMKLAEQLHDLDIK